MVRDARLQAVVETARAWRDPEYPARAEAVAATLEAPNRYTEEALAFAINQAMYQIEPERLLPWTEEAASPLTLGLWSDALWPMSDLGDALRVLLPGHRLLLVPSEADPVLLEAFLEDVRTRYPELPFRVAEDVETLLTYADAVLGTVVDEAALSERVAIFQEASMPHYFRMPGMTVGVLTGREDVDVRSALAEDLLLYEGRSPRNIRLLWAPEDLLPDPYLDVMAQFREVFPPHPETEGAQAMPRAFLEATGQPHARGPGFLVSKGEPEVQQPGHIRWVPYGSPDEVAEWLEHHQEEVDLLVVEPTVDLKVPAGIHRVPPGEVHRLPLNWEPEGWDTQAFIRQLQQDIPEE